MEPSHSCTAPPVGPGHTSVDLSPSPFMSMWRGLETCGTVDVTDMWIQFGPAPRTFSRRMQRNDCLALCRWTSVSLFSCNGWGSTIHLICCADKKTIIQLCTTANFSRFTILLKEGGVRFCFVFLRRECLYCGCASTTKLNASVSVQREVTRAYKNSKKPCNK